MQQYGPYYIGQVTLKGLRNWLIDNPLCEGDTLLLHAHTYEDVALDYREEYRAPMPEPYFLLGVLIDEAPERSGYTVPKDRILVLLEDDRPERKILMQQLAGPVDDGRAVYRCGWCGNLVDGNGIELQGQERSYAKTLLEMRGHRSTKHVDGKCCPNGHGR